MGKSIIFTVSQNHAAKITQVLNEFAAELYPGKYNSDFALQITSLVSGAQQHSINFQNNNLSGQSRFLENYRTSRTRVCVTVGMMTTGYDCQDLINVVLMRPIFSPTDFVQIKGRGTRRFTFDYSEFINGEIQKHKYEKKNFKLFDFFGNCEYFEEKYNYDEILKLPRRRETEGGGDNPTVFIADVFENFNPDPLKVLEETPVGLEGMKVDRKLYESFESRIQEDVFVREHYEEGNYNIIRQYLEKNIFNKPTDYIDMEKLRKAINIDRRIGLPELLDKIFGAIPYFKSKKEVVSDEFQSFQLIHPIEPDKYCDFKRFFETYLFEQEFRRIIEDRRYQDLVNYPSYTQSDLRKLGRHNMQIIVEYIQDNKIDKVAM